MFSCLFSILVGDSAQVGMAWASRPVHVACCNDTSGGYDCMPVHAMRKFVVPVIILGLGIVFEAFLAFHSKTT